MSHNTDTMKGDIYMANWSYYTIHAPNVGDLLHNENLINRNLVDELYAIDQNHLFFDTKGAFLMKSIAHISKTWYPNQEITISVVNEGSLDFETFFRMTNGIIHASTTVFCEDRDNMSWQPVSIEEHETLMAHAK